jgi:hypothetical protein
VRVNVGREIAAGAVSWAKPIDGGRNKSAIQSERRAKNDLQET